MKTSNIKQPSRGFTLLELMITVAIIAILASIAIPAYNGYILTAKLSEADNNLAALRLAEEEFFLENNNYFGGLNTSSVESASSNLWSATKGSNAQVNFSYVVSSSASTWSAVATGLSGSLLGKTRSASK